MLTQNDLKQIKNIVIPQFKAIDNKIDFLNLKLTGRIDVLESDISHVNKKLDSQQKEIKKIKTDTGQIKKDINLIMGTFDKYILDLKGRVNKLENPVNFLAS